LAPVSRGILGALPHPDDLFRFVAVKVAILGVSPVWYAGGATYLGHIIFFLLYGILYVAYSVSS